MQLNGIPTIKLLIEPNLLESLENNIWQEEPIPSKMIVNNHTYDIGLTYRGNHTRKFSKKSYRINFAELNKEFEGREIHLNAEYCDPSLIRNKLSFDFFKKMGSIAPDCKHVFIEVNEVPAGIYLQLESVDDLFLKKRQLSEGPIYYATNHQTNFSLLTTKGKLKDSLISGYLRKLGNKEDDLDLERFIANVNSIPRIDFGKEIVKYLDVNKYLHWLSGAICTQNYDGFIQNYAFYRNGQTGLYEMIPWDYDATFGRNWNGKVMRYDKVSIEGFNTLTARVLDVKEFRHQYRFILEEILKTHFTTSELEPLINSLHSKLRPYLAKDPYKKDTLELFDNEPNFIRNFIFDRNQYLRDHLHDLI
ncbi:Inner spore coat protein H [Bacillus sp. THAF10]|uniref:CotH kinase family protein n=1 Tax=Bacillus sp. THAF10 TaxID=2587848 RepID=UPI001267FCC5|nr:CotH kinase family protein [Bacillus sp. THAF10]QFT87899.1 Inner spore coat protein H [Bacillus sp. THAF10]